MLKLEKMQKNNQGAKALYIHIPFCEHICSYCDFCRVFYNRELSERYLKELKREISSLPGSFSTLYVGGGTPSVLEKDQLEDLFSFLSPYIQKAEECTVEANPENLDEEKIAILKKYGVNRISLGVQSFDEELLKSLNRRHENRDVFRVIEQLRTAGIDNISVDLIYGLPAQTKESFLSGIRTMIELALPHVSFYALTIEEHSEFGRKGIEALDEEISDAMYFEAIRLLEEKGYRQYEISNFCLPGKQSRHNLVYWNYGDYEGCGLNAAGKVKNLRYTNTRNFVEYLKGNHREEVLELNEKDLAFEKLMMGLRLKEGFVPDENVLNCFEEEIKEGIEKKRLLYEGKKLRCTDDWYYLLNDVLLFFMD